MNWKLTTHKRPDNMWEARYQEEEGLFVIDVAATMETAVNGARHKIIDPQPSFI